MTGYTVALGGSLIYWQLRNRGVKAAGMMAVVAALGMSNPLAGCAVAVGWLLLAHRARLAERRREADSVGKESTLLVQSLLVALSGGLSLAAALASVQPLLKSSLGDSVGGLRRSSRVEGLGPALQNAQGPGVRIFRQLGSAHLSGAPLVLPLSALSSEMHERERATALARARQLPVKMVVPLTLMMLPGFVLLTLGPPILSSLLRLAGPFVQN